MILVFQLSSHRGPVDQLKDPCRPYRYVCGTSWSVCNGSSSDKSHDSDSRLPPLANNVPVKEKYMMEVDYKA
jgi:hypothetical protein